MGKTILITGVAGFIGFHLSKKLLTDKRNFIIGLDNLNNYYDIKLKQARLKILQQNENFIFFQQDLVDKEKLDLLFQKHQPSIVVNLAAQAGVRYSLENPDSYINSNVLGFYNLLEICKKYPPQHLLFASSSSVYGNNNRVPFNSSDKNDEPLNLYAATKKTNELFAYAYHHLYHIPMTGMRFFTVYGPYGRPDMAYFSFTEKIAHNQPITVYNHGEMWRDFTYIDDVVEVICRLITKSQAIKENIFKIYNIGNNHPEKLSDFITILEKHIGKKAIIQSVPAPATDMKKTFANIDDLITDIDFKPETSLTEGLSKFIEWWKRYDS